MSIWEACRNALRGLLINRLRSALTMLGIIIGVSAVILLIAVGNGVKSSVNERLQPLANLITVVPSRGKVPGGGAPKNLIDADVRALEKALVDVVNVIPAVNGEAIVKAETTKSRSVVIGSTESWLSANNRDLDAGSFFSKHHVDSAARVVVLGPAVAKTLFGNPHAALRSSIRIDHQVFKVIGIMQSVGEPGDNDVVMPLDTAQRYIFRGGHNINRIIIQVNQVRTVPIVQEEVIRILSERHRINEPAKRDFEVQSLRTRLATVNQIIRIVTMFIGAVAAISLLIGAIGILNIMLVSVAERTREIGIRKAIGATRRAILQQFLMESIVLASLGGIIGILLGISLSRLGAFIVPTLHPALAAFAPTLPTSTVFISLMLSLAIGLFAGVYPAHRAARLQPVEALRHE